MATATKPKPSAKAAKPRTARAPASPWAEARVVMKQGSKELQAVEIGHGKFASGMAGITSMIKRSGPAKFTITIDTTLEGKV